MRVEPCKVCGGTEANLVDGFYYCVECGTQDVNVRETMIEDRPLIDGTFSIRVQKRVKVAIEEVQEMSPEWHKWHIYNFILSGMADELIAAGAKPSFKMKLLWLWTKYIKRFQDKEALGLTKNGEETEDQHKKDSSENEEDKEDEDIDEDCPFKSKKNTGLKKKNLKMADDVSIIKKGILCSLIYAALNLDESEIQFSDLLRFIREERLDFANYIKHVPKEVNCKSVPRWSTFLLSQVYPQRVEIMTMSIFRDLDILPVKPDLRIIVNKFIKELCLPNDFKNLVFSLIDLFPSDDILELNKSTIQTCLRFPSYECAVMAYFIVAFKMCFGLDDNYEVKMSDLVDKINNENCYLKSYKLGGYCEPTDRLFSFREWCSFIQLRKIILCKYYLYMAEECALDVDDYVYMEQSKGRKKHREPLLGDEITMNILGKIPQINNAEVIPKSEFKATLTPFSTYTDVVLQYLKDPDLRLVFSEDFTQYSLKYACEKLHLSTEDDVRNIIIGVDDNNKVRNEKIFGRLENNTRYNKEMVFVRNCDNKNWLKTKQPSIEHIIHGKKSNSDRDNDHGYDSPSENVSEIEISSKDDKSCDQDSAEIVKGEMEVDKKLEIVEEEAADANIFDDDFEHLVEEDKILDKSDEIKIKEAEHMEDCEDKSFQTFLDDPVPENENDQSIESCDLGPSFNPRTFNRSRTIKELILATCLKYNITIPEEYDPKGPKKRKSTYDGESGVKRRRVEDGSVKKKKKVQKQGEVDKLVLEYYNNLKNDVIFQISENVNRVVNNVHQEDITDQPEENSSLRNEQDEIATDIMNVEVNSNTFADEADNVECNENLEQSSLQIMENEDNSTTDDNFQIKADPRFDEKEYDIRQLYVKVNDDVDDEKSNTEDIFDLDKDPELFAVLDKKIEQADRGQLVPAEATTYNSDEEDDLPLNVLKDVMTRNERKNDGVDNSDDEDDLPLSVLKEELAIQQRKKEGYENLPKLVSNRKLTEFKYWTRFYASMKMHKLYELHLPFNLELIENFPVSFRFVFKECCGIIDKSAFHLYKSMVLLEQRILKQLKKPDLNKHH